jgi:hypothetical protein
MNYSCDGRRTEPNVVNDDRERGHQGLQLDRSERPRTQTNPQADVGVRPSSLQGGSPSGEPGLHHSGHPPATGAFLPGQHSVGLPVVAQRDLQFASVPSPGVSHQTQRDFRQSASNGDSGSNRGSRLAPPVYGHVDRATYGRKVISQNEGAARNGVGSVNVTRFTKTVKGIPVHIVLANVKAERNFKNPTPVIKFSVQVILDEMKLIEAPDFMLIDGRIQVPSKTVRIPDGEARVKVVKPFYPFLQLIWDAINSSDWWQLWPTLPRLIPIAPKNRGEDDDMGNREFESKDF